MILCSGIQERKEASNSDSPELNPLLINVRLPGLMARQP